MANSGPDFAGIPDAAPGGAKPADSAPDFSGIPDVPAPKQAYDATAHINPDVAARVLPLAQQTGEDPAFVEKNLADFEKAAKEPAPGFWDDMKTAAPTAFKILSAPGIMALTHDDLQSLPAIERMARTFREGAGTYLRADLAGAKLTAIRLGAGLASAGSLAARTAPLVAGAGFSLPDPLSAEDREYWQHQMAKAEEEQKQAFSKLPDNYGTTVARSVPMLTGAVAAMAAGGPAGEAAYWGANGFSDIYGQLKDTQVNGKPVPDDVAAVAALAGGLAMAGISSAQVMPLARSWLSKVPGGDRFLTTLLAETPDEVLKSATVKGAVLNSAINFLKDSGHAAAIMTAFNAAQETAVGSGKLMAGESPAKLHPFDAALESVAGGLKGAAEFGPLTAFGAISGGIKGYEGYEARVKSQVADLTLEASKGLQHAAELSKLAARNRPRFEEAVGEVLKNSDMETAHIPLEAAQNYLYQSGRVDPDAFLKEMGAEQSYQDALKTGEPVEIPTAKILGTPHFQELMGDIKYGADDMTPNESAAEDKLRYAQRQQQEASASETRKKVEADYKAIQSKIDEGDVAAYNRRSSLVARLKGDMGAAFIPDNVPEPMRAEMLDKTAQINASYLMKESERRPGVDPEQIYQEAIKGWVAGGRQERISPEQAQADWQAEQGRREQFDAISKTGGLSPTIDAIIQAGGMTPATYKKYFPGELQDIKIPGLLREKGGLRVSQMAEALSASKIMPEYDEQAMLERVRDEVRAINEFKAKHGEDAYAALRRKVVENKPFLLFQKSPDEISRFNAENEQIEKRYAQAVDDIYAGRPSPSHVVPLGHTSGVLEFLGAQQQPMVIAPDVVVKAREKHGFSAEDVKKLPAELRDPIMVFQSGKDAKSLVALTDLRSGRKPEGIAVVNLDRAEGRYSVNRIASLGARDTANIKSWLDEGLLRYADRDRATDWLRRGGIDGPAGGSASPYITSVPSKEDVVKALGGLYQEGQAGDRGAVRGFFDAEKKLVNLMRTADPSTLIHEPLHAFAQEMFGYLRSGQAEEKYLRYFEPARKFLGIEDNQKKLTAEQHEKLSSNLEGYFMQGKDIPHELAGAATAYRRWMLQVYKQSEGAPISEEMRAFFSRMYGGEAAVADALRETGYNPEAVARAAGVDPKDKEKLAKLQSDAHDEAVAQVTKEVLREVRGSYKNWLDGKRKMAESDAAAEAEELPLYRAQEYLAKEGGAKDVREACRDFIAGKLDPAQAVHFDLAAELHGFADGEDLAQKTIEGRTLQQETKARTDQKMLDYLDAEPRAARRKYALDIVHNERWDQVLAAEQKILEDKLRGQQVSARVAQLGRVARSEEYRAMHKEAAKMLERQPFMKAGDPRVYLQAEKNAARRLGRAMEAGDAAKALEAQKQERFNKAAYVEATKNKKEIDVRMRRVAKLADRGQDLKGMPYGFARVCDDLLARFGLAEAKPEDMLTQGQIADEMLKRGKGDRDQEAVLDMIANATRLVRDEQNGGWRVERPEELVERINKSYGNLDLVMPTSLADPRPRRKEDLSLNDLRDIDDFTRQLAHIGRQYDKFLSFYMESKPGTTIQQAALEWAGHMAEQAGQNYEHSGMGSKYDRRYKETAAKILNAPDKAFVNNLATLLSLTDYLDGGDKQGPGKKYFYRILESAENTKLEHQFDMVKGLSDIFGRFYEPSEMGKWDSLFGQRYRFDFIRGEDKYLNKLQVFCALLNRGNEHGKDRLMRGHGISAEDVDKLFWKDSDGREVLGEKDLKCAQAIWDYLNEDWWPKIKEQEMRIKGVEPEAVEPLPFMTPYGEARGGYYPLGYDPSRDASAAAHEENLDALHKMIRGSVAQTRQGFLRNRVMSLDRPLLLDLKVLYRHLEDVTHDLAFRAGAIDCNRMLRSKDVSSAIVSALDVNGLRRMQKDVADMARSEVQADTPFDQALRWFRFAATYKNIAFRPIIGPLKLSADAVNGAAEIGPAKFAAAGRDALFNPQETLQFVTESSVMMRQRATLLDATLKDIFNKYQGKGSNLLRTAFIAEYAADRMTSTPLWMAAYNEALPKVGHGDAVLTADEAVKRAIGGGTMLDRIPMQRGTEFQRALSMLYSFKSVMANRWWMNCKMSGMEYAKGNLAKALGTVGAGIAAYWLVPALYENMWRELFRNGQEDEDTDEKVKRALGRTAEIPASYVPFVRDLAGTAISSFEGHKGQSFRLSPAEQAVDEFTQPLYHLAHFPFGEEDWSEKDSEDAGKMLDLFFKTPQSLNNTLFNFYDWLENNGELTWRDLLGQRKARK